MAGSGTTGSASVEVLVDVVSEFLEAALHTILYSRELYPLTAFSKVKKYNAAVYMCRHPDVAFYIRHAVASLQPLLRQGLLQRCIVVVTKPDRTPLERFIFEFDALWTRQPGAAAAAATLQLSAAELEAYFRAFMSKIMFCDHELKPNPPDATFSILAHVRQVDGRTIEAALTGEEVGRHLGQRGVDVIRRR